jgi:hypothetical protein
MVKGYPQFGVLDESNPQHGHMTEECLGMATF